MFHLIMDFEVEVGISYKRERLFVQVRTTHSKFKQEKGAIETVKTKTKNEQAKNDTSVKISRHQ